MHKFTTTFCFAILTVLLLNSAHSKDILNAHHVQADKTIKSQTNTDTILDHKLGADLHNHVDKAGKIFNGDNPQSDQRSLRLLRERRPTRQSLLNELLDAWRERLTFYLS